MADKPKNGDRNGLVLTPGGLRARHLVREVAPGEFVQFDNRGKATLKKKASNKPAKGTGKGDTCQKTSS